jgi:hypothetical protein
VVVSLYLLVFVTIVFYHQRCYYFSSSSSINGGGYVAGFSRPHCTFSTKPTKPSQKRLFPQNDDEVEETTNITAYTDIEFQKVFLEDNPQFKDLTDVTLHIMEYETNTNIQLTITNSQGKRCYCQYACCTHQNCLFRVSFGLTPDKEAIICRGNNLEHSGSLHEQTAKGGRKRKSRKKDLLNVCYDFPKAKHVQAAAAKQYSVTVPYDAALQNMC